MRREGRIPGQRYVMQWVERTHPVTGDVYYDTERFNRVVKFGSNHSKWDIHHDILHNWRSSPFNKSSGKRKGQKNKHKQGLIGTTTPDCELSDPSCPHSCEAREIAEAMDTEDMTSFSVLDPCFSADCDFEAPLIDQDWPFHRPGVQPGDFGSASAYEREWPALLSCKENACFDALGSSSSIRKKTQKPSSAQSDVSEDDEEDLTVYGGSPEAKFDKYFDRSLYQLFPNQREMESKPLTFGSGTPGSLIPAVLKYPSSEVDSYERYNETLVEGSSSEDEMGSLDDQDFFKLDEELSPSGLQRRSKVPSSPEQSFLGDFAEIKDEEWDIVSDEGSWEEEIFDESDMCTISVQYGSKK